jgi:hypothetical protein
MAKKMAAQKAREYGIRVGELVKANCRPREQPKKEISKQERAKQFAKTVPKPVPAKRAEAKAETNAPAQSAALVKEPGTAAAPVMAQRRDSVSSLMNRHDTNAKSIADIKADICRWELEDHNSPKIPQLPRRKSPGRKHEQLAPLPQAAQAHPPISLKQEAHGTPLSPAAQVQLKPSPIKT